MNSKSQLLTEAWHSRNGVPRNAACMFRSRYWSGAACITGSYISWLTFPPRQRQSYLILPARLSQDFLFVNLAFISKHLMCHYTPFNHFKKRIPQFACIWLQWNQQCRPSIMQRLSISSIMESVIWETASLQSGLWHTTNFTVLWLRAMHLLWTASVFLIIMAIRGTWVPCALLVAYKKMERVWAS